MAGKKFQRQYKHNISNYKHWCDKSHAEQWLIYPQNITAQLSIDEVGLSGGELYTIVTAKSAKGKKGCLVAIIKGTSSDVVVRHLRKIDSELRYQVHEITLDMSGAMKQIARLCFPHATQVIDRFHVQQLATEAIKDLRIQYRWEAMEQENNALKLAKENKIAYTPTIFSNGDTVKQLLVRSRLLLYKSSNNWTEDQKARAEILFEQYPVLKRAYDSIQGLREIYNRLIPKNVARLKLALWYSQIETSGIKTFKTLANSVKHHHDDILNYFDQRSTNASAESFNAKIKLFRANLRGVKDKAFFLFRLTKIFA